MADKELLKKMLDAVINGEEETAQVNFHSYVTDKTREILRPELNADNETNSDD